MLLAIISAANNPQPALKACFQKLSTSPLALAIQMAYICFMHLRITGLILFILTLLWVVLMGISTAPIEPEWSAVSYLDWASKPSFSYLLNYINVTLLTAGVVFLFVQLFVFLRVRNRQAALAALMFVPIYGMLNLICYSIQISVVPAMAENALHHEDSLELVAQLVQANPDSLVGFLNGLAYALLGIPSMIYGCLLIKESKAITGYALLFSGFQSLLGLAGMLMDSRILSLGILIGGFLFLISLGGILFEFSPRFEGALPSIES